MTPMNIKVDSEFLGSSIALTGVLMTTSLIGIWNNFFKKL